MRALVEDNAGVSWNSAIAVEVGHNIRLIWLKSFDVGNVVVAQRQLLAINISEVEGLVGHEP